jgi:hypothetical protein
MSSGSWTPCRLAAKAREVRTISDRAGDRRIAGLSLVALLSLTPAVARAGQPVGTPPGQGGQSGQPSQPGQGKGDEIDAEMLRDLEVLNNPNYARDQEIGKRLTFYERMRMLDRWLSNRPAPENDPNAPAAPAKREVR